MPFMKARSTLQICGLCASLALAVAGCREERKKRSPKENARALPGRCD